MHRYLAQLKIGNEVIESPLKAKDGTQYTNLGQIIGAVTNFMIPIGAVILLFVLIMGGYEFMLSQGSPDKIKSARAKIVSGIIGLVLMAFAFIIAKLISYMFDINGGVL